MRWVRVHAHFDVWAANGPAPTFCITSDDDGVAFLEIAKRPELLFRPVSDPSDSWNVFFSATGSNDGTVAATEIPITRGRADYTLPDGVWRNMRRVADGPREGDRLLYYRVKARPRGVTRGWASHSDTDIQNGNAPFIEVVPLSGDLSQSPIEDSAALERLDLFSRLWLSVIQLLGDDPDRQALQRLLAHPTYREQSSPTTRAKVLKLFVICGSRGRQLFPRLLDLRVQTGSNITEPAIFYRDEANEGTMLDHLVNLWDIQLDRRIPIALSEVIYEVMNEAVDPPGQLNQGAAGTCAATSVQTYVALRNPAEYARWCRYILDRRSRHRVRLANGDHMRANPEAFDVATWRNVLGGQLSGNWQMILGRTYSERGIQAALMDYGNYRMRYDPERDRFVNWLGQVSSSGLWEFEISRVIEAVFNEPWKFDFGGGTLNSAPNSNAADNLITHFQGGGLPVIITMLWGTAAHAVLGLRIENNRVIFRNPQYRGNFPTPGLANGTTLNQPTRQVHNVSRAEESMDRAGLRAALRGFCEESSNASDRGYTVAEIPASLHGTVTPTAR